LEIKSQDDEYERILKITPWGIEGSTKMVNYEEGTEIFFGCDEYINDVRILFLIIFRKLLILFYLIKMILIIKMNSKKDIIMEFISELNMIF